MKPATFVFTLNVALLSALSTGNAQTTTSSKTPSTSANTTSAGVSTTSTGLTTRPRAGTSAIGGGAAATSTRSVAAQPVCRLRPASHFEHPGDRQDHKEKQVTEGDPSAAADRRPHDRSQEIPVEHDVNGGPRDRV